ncbi:hypothetical protein KIPB_011900, partial [Kipferlia bialata]|eukprot:g11900.t1
MEVSEEGSERFEAPSVEELREWLGEARERLQKEWTQRKSLEESLALAINATRELELRLSQRDEDLLSYDTALAEAAAERDELRALYDDQQLEGDSAIAQLQDHIDATEDEDRR